MDFDAPYNDGDFARNAEAPAPANDLSPEELAATQRLQPLPENFRWISQIYSDQMSFVRLTYDTVQNVLSNALFDVSGDLLRNLQLSDPLVEFHARIVDLLVLTGLGQSVDVREFQEYAKALATCYGNFDFIPRVQNSAMRGDANLQVLEQEWLSGTDFTRVQQFYRSATTAVAEAAKYCNITIASLPEF